MSSNTTETHTAPEETSQNSMKTERRPKSRTKRLVSMGVIAVVLAASAFIGMPYYLEALSHESTDDAFVESHVLSISPRVAGHVARVLVEDNQWVEKDQLLAEIDPSDFQVALEAAKARLESAKAAVKEAAANTSAAANVLAQRRAELQMQQATLEQVRAEVAEVDAEHQRDMSDLERLQKMIAAKAISRQEFDHAKTNEAMTRAKYDSALREVDTHSVRILQAKAALATAEDEYRGIQAQAAIRAAELSEAEANVKQAELNLSYTKITAPCAGHVTKKVVEPRTYVLVGENLLSVVSPEVWVVANFKETQIANMRAGQPVDIEVDSYPDTTFHGHVDSIQRGTGSRFSLLPPENATGNYIKVVQRVPVKIVLDDPTPEGGFVLAPGMSVVPMVDISAPGKDTGLAVQESATAVASSRQ